MASAPSPSGLSPIAGINRDPGGRFAQRLPLGPHPSCNCWAREPLNDSEGGKARPRQRHRRRRSRLLGGLSVIILGIILLIVGWALTIPVLWTIGIILVLIGVVLWVMGSVGHAVGGRRHYF
jgi:uncharacterized membrane protein YdbT with pleckstrin-like domain